MSTRALVLVVIAEALGIVLLATQFGSKSPPGAPAHEPEIAGRQPAKAHQAHPGPEAPGEQTTAPERRPAGIAAPVYRPEDGVGIVVHGVVRNVPPGGRLVPSIWFRRGALRRFARSEADGRYALSGLSPGAWQVRCEAEGAQPWEREVTLTDAGIQRLDIDLEFAQVVKVVVLGPKGEPLRKELWETAKVGFSQDPYALATTAPLPDALPAGTLPRRFGLGVAEWVDPKTSEDVLRGVIGALHLSSPPPVHASLVYGQAVLARQVVRPGQEEIVFALELDDVLGRTATVQLCLLDGRSGAPMPGVKVSVGRGGRAEVTDAEGRATATGLPPGFMKVRTWGEDLEHLFHYVRVGPGEVRDLGDLSLWPLTPIRGVVLGADGEPAEARLHWDALDLLGDTQPMVETKIASANAAGQFELWGCGRRRYVVRARDREGRFGHAVIDATGGPVRDAVLHLRETAVVTAEHAFDPSRSFLLTVRTGDLPLYRRVLEAYRERTRLQLPPGSYVVEIHRTDGELVRSFALQVESLPVTFQVP